MVVLLTTAWQPKLGLPASEIEWSLDIDFILTRKALPEKHYAIYFSKTRIQFSTIIAAREIGKSCIKPASSQLLDQTSMDCLIKVYLFDNGYSERQPDYPNLNADAMIKNMFLYHLANEKHYALIIWRTNLKHIAENMITTLPICCTSDQFIGP